MLAAVLQAFGQPLAWQEIPTPQPAPHEVLVEVRSCGIDGTDLKLMQGFGYKPALPFVPGHEIAGVVTEVGVDVHHPPPGTAVIVYNFATCGTCIMCQANRSQLCLDMGGVMGVLDAHGGMAEYVRVPATQVVPVSPALSFVDAATCCDAGLTALHAVNRAALQAGEVVLVIGVGGVGSFVVQLVKHRQARAIAVELGAVKQDWAREMGAEAVLDGTRTTWTESLHALGLAHGVDCVLDIVGSRTTMRAALEVLRPGGRMVLVGYTPDDLQVPAKTMAQRELQVLGTRAGTRQDLQDVADLLAHGELRSIVTRTFPMAEINEALDLLRSGRTNGRIVLLAPRFTP